MPCLVMRKPKIREGLKTRLNMTAEEDGDNEVEVATSLLTDIVRPTTSNRIIKEKFVVLDTKYLKITKPDAYLHLVSGHGTRR